MSVIAVTGHRPEKLGGYSDRARRTLGGFAVERFFIAREKGLDRVITGMALGWDQAVAGACIALDIPFTAAIPFAGQERRWPRLAQERYHRLLARADQVEIVSPQFINVNRAMQLRNEWMVDRADAVVALWDGSWGGTHNCIEYARKRGVEVLNLWPNWILDEETIEMLE